MRRNFPLLMLVTIIMSCPLAAQNTPPVFNQTYDTVTISEGDVLSWDISVYEANAGDSLSMFVDPPIEDPVYKGYLTFDPVDDTTYNFHFNPLYDFVAVGEAVVSLTVYATDQLDTISMAISITVTNRNEPPVFNPLPDTSISEGVDTLRIEVVAIDPEGGIVALSAPVLDSNMTFETDGYAQDTGLFTFAPGYNQGGLYHIMFKALDNDQADPRIDSITLNLDVLEIDQPPYLVVTPVGSQILHEGNRLRLNWKAYDDFQANLRVKIMPPPDSSVFKGDMTMVQLVDNAYSENQYIDSGYLEFTPDYNYLQGRSDTVIVLRFSAGDVYDTARTERVITVYNVEPDNNDPGLSDTVIVHDAIWADSIATDSLPGFALRVQIWNDSAVAAAMTGFRWKYPWLKCDSIVFDSGNFNDTLGNSVYTKDYIYNDSMMFLAVFIYYDSLYLDSGYSDYFTAYFKYDPDEINIDSIPYVRFDTTKVGSSGEFFLDKRLRGAPPLKISDEDLLLSLKESFTYKPLVQMGQIRIPVNRVRMEIFDTDKGLALGNGNTLYARNEQYEPKLYEFRLLIENKVNLQSMYFDFAVANDDGNVVWDYQDPIISAVPVSRMYPDTTIWDNSSGIQLAPYSMDGLAADSFRIFGVADPVNGGLPPGQIEYMVRIPFSIVDVTGSDASLDFDSTAIGAFGAWLFTDTAGNPVFPTFSGGLHLGVQYAPDIVTDRVRMQIYDKSTNVALGEDDSLYVRDESYNPKQYELRLQLENKRRLADMALGFRIYSENQDVLWTYGDTLYSIDTLSRIYPDTAVWPVTAGMQFAQFSLDGQGADTIRISGSADTDSSGLPPGPLATMVKIPFTLTDVAGEEGTLCLDSDALTSDWWHYTIFPDSQVPYTQVAPIFEGRFCYPVQYSPTIRADRVNLVVYDMDQLVALDPDSFLYIVDSDEQPKHYALRIQMENRRKLQNLSLDFQIYSPAGDVTWAYQDTLMRVLSTSRMYPDDSIWALSSGLQLSQYSVDGSGIDSLRFDGSADPTDGGMPYGPLEDMITIPFNIENVAAEGGMLCFDTGAVQTPGHWYFTDSAGTPNSPIFEGQLCFPVYYSHVTDVGDEQPPLPFAYRLDQNYPNPFNPSTTIRFSLSRRDHVRITVFNILGQVVTILADGAYDPGEHSVVWNGHDSQGQAAASGIYLYHLESEGLTTTKKMILLR